MTKDELDELLSFDEAKGRFIWRKSGAVAGTPRPGGHRQIGIRGRIYLEHRLVWLHVQGNWPAREIDHINGVKDDNRPVNLRDVTRETNAQNVRSANIDSKTGYLGVTHSAGRYASKIHVGGKAVFLGRFDCPAEAHRAYVSAKRQFHGGNTL